MTYQCYNMETLVSIESSYFKSVVLQFLPSVLDLILHLVIMCPWLFYSGMFFCLSLSFTTLRLLKINGWDWSHVPQFGFVRCFLTIQFRSCILGENIIHDSLLPSASCRESHDVGVTPLVPTWITC